MTYLPATNLPPIFSPWPFVQLGMDIVGPMKRDVGNKRFLLVATNYFTKWVKFIALPNIYAHDVLIFLWEEIVYRFELPYTNISYNGKQFDAEVITTLCSSFSIRHNFSALYHPQANGQTKATNKTLLVY